MLAIGGHTMVFKYASPWNDVIIKRGYFDIEGLEFEFTDTFFKYPCYQNKIY